MENAVVTIDLYHLALAFIPVLAVLAIYHYWALSLGLASYALLRMLGQLMIVGYFLSYIFASDSAPIVVTVLAVMVLAASWIALQTVVAERLALYWRALSAILLGGGLVLALITGLVLELEPWYLPRYMVPLAGMVFANAMTSVSLSAERMVAELRRGESYETAKVEAFNAALIPVISSLLAVGLVSLPGMMTGQILSGVSPLIAARYQIMVMCMIFASAGLSTALFLTLARPLLSRQSPPSSDAS